MSLPVLKRVHSKSKTLIIPPKNPRPLRSQRNLASEELNLLLKNQQIAQEHRNIRMISNYIDAKIIPRNNLRSNSPFHKRIQTELNKDPVKGHFLEPTRILITSSPKWVIYQRQLQKYERGFRTQQPHKIQGLSKLLMFYCAYVIVAKYELQINKFECIAPPSIEGIPPSVTPILKDDMVTLQSLLNIMILEQSLQAEYSIAVNLGLFIFKQQSKKLVTIFDVNRKNQHKFIEIFLKFMNATTAILKLHKTLIKDIGIDPVVSLNKSCANDIAKLSIECLKIEWISDILKRDIYVSYIRCIDEDGELANRPISVTGWQSKDYLQYRYIGRSSSKEFGHSSCSILYETERVSAVIVLLGSYSHDERERDIQISIEYFLKKKGLLGQQKGKGKEESKGEREKEEKKKEKKEG